MNRLCHAIGVTVLFAGCTVPDVTPELAASVDLLAATDSRLRPGLSTRAAQEVRQAEDKLIGAGKSVYVIEDCDDADDFGLMTNCRLEFLGKLEDGPANATQVLAALNDVEAYFATLLVLASDQDSKEVRAQAQNLADALDEAAAGRSEALAELAKGAGKRSDAFVAGAGFLADQYRMNALRSLVRQADPIIDEQTRVIASYLDLDSALPAAHAAFLDAQEEAVNAQEAGDAQRYRQAIERLKAAHLAYQKALKESPSYAMKLLRQSHAQLLSRVKRRGSAEEILKTLTEIETIIELARKEK